MWGSRDRVATRWRASNRSGRNFGTNFGKSRVSPRLLIVNDRGESFLAGGAAVPFHGTRKLVALDRQRRAGKNPCLGRRRWSSVQMRPNGTRRWNPLWCRGRGRSVLVGRPNRRCTEVDRAGADTCRIDLASGAGVPKPSRIAVIITNSPPGNWRLSSKGSSRVSRRGRGLAGFRRRASWTDRRPSKCQEPDP